MRSMSRVCKEILVGDYEPTLHVHLPDGTAIPPPSGEDGRYTLLGTEVGGSVLGTETRDKNR